MKIFKKSEYNYSKLSRLTYIKGVFITAGAVLIIFLLRLLSRGHLADRIAEWIARQFSLSDFQAEMAYFNLITLNMQYILATVIIIFMLLLFRMLLNSYKKYFDEVVNGIDQLIDEDGQISLSPELEVVEHKLIHVSHTLKIRDDEKQDRKSVV